MKYKALSIFPLLCSLGTPSFGDPMIGEAELGFVQFSGNSESHNANSRLTLEKNTENWQHAGLITAMGNSVKTASGDTQTTAERYTGRAKSNYAPEAESNYPYLLAEYEDDRFSGYEYQASAGLGYGFIVLNTATTLLALEVGTGYGYRKVKYVPVRGRPNVRVGKTLEWKFSKHAALTQGLSIEKDKDNSITRYDLNVTSTLTETLALKVGTEIKYTREVLIGTKHTNRMTFANIVYKF
jgi:putative salt-induced outer membrane protein